MNNMFILPSVSSAPCRRHIVMLSWPNRFSSSDATSVQPEYHFTVWRLLGL